MKPPKRHGVWKNDGLCGDFRFIRSHTVDPYLSLVQTVAGQALARDTDLVWDTNVSERPSSFRQGSMDATAQPSSSAPSQTGS